MSLLTNLVSYWAFDEASGNRADSNGSNTLTDNNTVGSATGKINLAADFEADNSETLSHASNSDLQIASTSVSYEFSVWAKPESLSTQQLITKRTSNNVSDGLEYMLRFDSGTPTMYWGYAGGGGFGSIASSHTVSTGTWYFVTFGFEDSTGRFFISVDNNTLEYSSGGINTQTVAGSNPFAFGGTDQEFYDGLIDESGFWKGRTLTSGERTSLYNGGSGLPYSSFGGGGGGVKPYWLYASQSVIGGSG